MNNNYSKTFIEHFYLFGLDIDLTIKENYLYNLKSFNIINNDIIKPKILNKFPPFNKKNSYIDENVLLSHVFNNNFKIKEKYKKPSNEFFHFNLDNLLGTNKIFFTCVLFYEPLSNYYEFKNEYETFNNLENKINSNIIENSINLKESLNEKDLLNKKHFFNQNILQNSNLNFNLRQSFIPTLKNNCKIAPISDFINNKKDINIMTRINVFSSIYIPKVICLSSLSPFVQEKITILNKLIEYINKKDDITIPIEKIIENLVLNIPFPERGIAQIIYKDSYLFNSDSFLIIKQNAYNKFLIPSYKMQYIFEFSTKNILEIIRCILLEIPILFFSESCEKLTNIILTFLYLIYPIKYKHPNCSILPNINIGIIEKEKKFIFGINEKYSINFFKNYNLKIYNKIILICDIDKKNISEYYEKEKFHIINLKNINVFSKKYLNENYKELFYENKNDFLYLSSININNDCNKNLKIPLLNKHSLKLEKKLNNYFSKNSEKLNSNLYNEKINIEIVDIFFYFMICILKKYLFYIEKDENIILENIKNIKMNKKIKIDDLFKIDDFLEKCQTDDYLFFKSFFATKNFKEFIIRKIYNKNDEDRIEFLLIDEYIIKKNNKKKIIYKNQTRFLDNNLIDISNKNLIEIQNSNNFNEKEINFINNNTNNFYLYYQKYNKDKKTYKYFVFPKLIYDNNFFDLKYSINENNNNNNNFQLIQNEKKKLINSIIKHKDYFLIYKGEFINQFLFDYNSYLFEEEIKNFIFLLWFKIFSITFNNNDENEKFFRFYDLLNNLNKIIYFEDNIFSFIYAFILKNDNEEMIINFFDKIKNKNYIHYCYLVNKLLLKKKIKYKKKNFVISNTKLNFIYFSEENEENTIQNLFKKNYDINNKNNIKKLRKRTFNINNKNNNNNSNEIIKFKSYFQCNFCKENLNISFLSLRFDLVKKNNNNFYCSKCEKIIEPFFEIKINNNIDKIMLYNPYYLYNHISNNYINEFILNDNNYNYESFINKNKNLFWNCVWYFEVFGLNYDIMLNYKNEEEKNEKKCFNNLIIEKININI